jgi:hypothetical protein
MSYPINYPTPQGANIQIFNAGDSAAFGAVQSWIKPQGASFVWFTLIGAGGAGGGYVSGSPGDGGGSGAVTNCMVPAFLIPDELQVNVGKGGAGALASQGDTGGQTYIAYSTNITNNTILYANGGIGGDVLSGAGPGAGGAAMTSNFFSCMGFFQSVAGQSGGTQGTASTPVASTTTFLGGGGYQPIPNYGYPNGAASLDGFFLMQPIIVGRGGASGNSGSFASAGIGCGSGGSVVGQPAASGGNGMVVIITW